MKKYTVNILYRNGMEDSLLVELNEEGFKLLETSVQGIYQNDTNASITLEDTLGIKHIIRLSETMRVTIIRSDTPK